MIHSLAGGNLGGFDIVDLIKTEIVDGKQNGNMGFYLSNEEDIKLGDIVLVPSANKSILKAKVVKIYKDVKSNCSPIPLKNLKHIIKVVGK